MSSPYYTGDSVPLGVSVTENDTSLEIISAKVTVYEPDHDVKLIDNADASIGGDDDNEATYLLAKGKTTKAGRHYAYFICQFSGNRERTFEIMFEVYDNPRYKVGGGE